jgi:hypothetical protein
MPASCVVWSSRRRNHGHVAPQPLCTVMPPAGSLRCRVRVCAPRYVVRRFARVPISPTFYTSSLCCASSSLPHEVGVAIAIYFLLIPFSAEGRWLGLGRMVHHDFYFFPDVSHLIYLVSFSFTQMLPASMHGSHLRRLAAILYHPSPLLRIWSGGIGLHDTPCYLKWIWSGRHGFDLFALGLPCFLFFWLKGVAPGFGFLSTLLGGDLWALPPSPSEEEQPFFSFFWIFDGICLPWPILS